MLCLPFHHDTILLVRLIGLEPTRPFGQQTLILPWLPLQHSRDYSPYISQYPYIVSTRLAAVKALDLYKLFPYL